jgi:RNA polymerase sigma-70 factor (ECF subfamily)
MFTMEIARLIERCRQGDADALGELYKAYAQRMRGVCRRYVSDEQDVDDVLHDAFVIIFTSFDHLRDNRKAESWMMSITRNVASKYKDYLDSQPFVPLEEAELLAAPDEKTTVRGIPLEDVLRMVERLPEGYGQVFRLSVFDGMSHKEIATMLGIEPHSSSSQLARAKKMLRKMMQQYWVVLLLLFIPITFLLLKRNADVKEGSPVVAKQNEEPKESTKEQPQEHAIVHLPVHHTGISTDTLQPVIIHAIDSIMSDSLSNMIAQEQTALDTIRGKEQADTTQVLPTNPQNPLYDIVDFIPATPIKKQMKSNWQLALAYAGTPSSDMTRTDNYMTMPSYSGAVTRSTKLYNWGDYMDYVNENAPMMDSVSASNMSRVAIINSSHPSEPLTETKHHERPLTLQFSLSRQFNSRWSLSTGLSYTRMKSTFQGGNENTLIHRTQRLHYLGIPLRLNYRLMGGKRWSLYTSGGLQLDLPVSGTLSTQYIYGGPYTDLNNSPAVETTINAPWQWSFGVGTGLQYEIVPHLKVYLEPSLNYYIPSSDAVETYRTEHPFDLSLPLGIRFTW